MPDQVRHDGQKLDDILNYDTASQGRGDLTFYGIIIIGFCNLPAHHLSGGVLVIWDLICLL
jgi:hypothetical protein